MNGKRFFSRLVCISVVVFLSALQILEASNTFAAERKEGLASSVQPRVKYTINDNWRFAEGDIAGAQKPGFDDSGWDVVNVPHTWNAKDKFGEMEQYRFGKGWYRKKISLDNNLKGKKLYLYFEAANQETEVFVNGKSLGSHKGGYSGFVFDITDAVEFGDEAKNVIAVKVDVSWNKDIPPITTEAFAIYGGIYRDVWVVAANPVHVAVSDYASSGVYIDTPNVSKESGSVKIRGTVVNESDEAKKIKIVNTIVDAEKLSVASITTDGNIEAGGSQEFVQTIKIPSPKLWSPKKPNLYTVYTHVYEGERLVDRVENPLGFRWFRFDPNEGFFLNGEHMMIKGTSRHQDYGDLGNAISNRLHRKDMELIKEMGANFVRLGHYPQDPVVLAAADELGLMIWEEIPISFYACVSKESIEMGKYMLHEMIKQHYNHPSIIMWGYMNEVLLRDSEGKRGKKNPEYVAKVVEFGKELEALVRELDSSRATVMAIHNNKIYDQSGIADVPQILGWNKYDGWYGGKFSGFGSKMDTHHSDNPERVLMVSEYGAGSDSRLHSLVPNTMDFSCEWQHMFHENYLRQIKERPFIAGTTVWNQFNFRNRYSQDSIPGMNQKGLMNIDRTPKDVYYLFKANYFEGPVLYIATRQWNHRTGTDPNAELGSGKQPVKQLVTVFSNLDEVEVFANGKSLGVKKPNVSCVATWDVPFEDGVNIIEAKGKKGREVLNDKTEVKFTYRAPILADASVPFGELAVNIGSHMQFIDENELVWEADQAYSPGGWGYVGGQKRQFTGWAKKSENITGTDEDPIYQRFLTGLESYRFDVPDGDYQVELRLTDYENDKVGERIFSVEINGQSVIENLDLVDKYGHRRAFTTRFEVAAVNKQGVKIDFKPVKGEPVLCAIRIRKLR